jgi:hypothetical protein
VNNEMERAVDAAVAAVAGVSDDRLPRHKVMRAAILAADAARGEPVAEVVNSDLGPFLKWDQKWLLSLCEPSKSMVGAKLYTAPQPQQPAPECKHTWQTTGGSFNLAQRELRCSKCGHLRTSANPAPQDCEKRCTCPSGDGSLEWPCAVHPPSTQQTGVRELAEAVFNIPVPTKGFREGWRDEEIWQWALGAAASLILGVTRAEAERMFATTREQDCEKRAREFLGDVIGHTTDDIERLLRADGAYTVDLDDALRAIAAALAAKPTEPRQSQGEWSDEVVAILEGYGFAREAAVVFASAELKEYADGECDCAEMSPRDWVDLLMGVGADVVERWKTESAGRSYGYKPAQPPHRDRGEVA